MPDCSAIASRIFDVVFDQLVACLFLKLRQVPAVDRRIGSLVPNTRA